MRTTLYPGLTLGVISPLDIIDLTTAPLHTMPAFLWGKSLTTGVEAQVENIINYSNIKLT